MIRRLVPFALLTSLGSLGLASLAVGQDTAVGRYSVYPPVVATVLTLEPRSLAIIQSTDGMQYEVLRRTGWRVGDTVICEHAASERPSAPAWQTLTCRKEA